MVIVLGIHLFPFRTEKLSPIAPMVLRNSGRVGSRHLLKRHLSSQKLTWVPLLFLLHRCAASILYEYLLLRAFMPPSFIYSPLFHPFPPFLNRIFSTRTCVTALFEHSCSAHIYSMGALFSWHTIFWAYYLLGVLSSWRTIFLTYYLLVLLFSWRTIFWANLLSTCIYALPPPAGTYSFPLAVRVA